MEIEEERADTLLNADTRIFFLLNSLAGKSKAGDFLIALLAEYMAYALLGGFLLALFFAPAFEYRKFQAFAIVFLAGLVSRFVFATLIRVFYKRRRPHHVHKVHAVLSEKSFSFPSGHSSFFYAFSSAMYLFDPALGAWFVAATAVMTVCRVVAGVHYLTDILGGLFLGIITAILAYFFLAPHIVPHIVPLAAFALQL
ncbi:MAG TPA: phosphatase PAP2 family protein [Candidatus Paceibacterota bacterium]|nr:phosphatase PAP2 family protein [Candidatus Paceibacterota bacterium]